MSISYCLAALLLAISAAACPIDISIPNLQVGSAYFSTSSKSKSSQITNAFYDHTFTGDFNPPPAVALSLHCMGTEAVLSQWSLQLDTVTSFKMTVRFRHRPIEWTMVRAGFWATNRNDIHLGSISSSLNLKQSTAFLYPSVKPTMTNLNISVMRAFITGYTLRAGNEMFIRAFDKTLSSNKIEIGVQVGGSMEISFVTVNYIIFCPQSSSFASYGGGANQVKLTDGRLLNIHKIIHESPYTFHGIANVRQSLQAPMMILTEINPTFYLKIDTLAQIQQVYVSYIVIGIAPSKLCSTCKQSLIYNQQCVSSCPPGAYPIEYQNGGRGCRVCPDQLNMVVSPTNNGCVCKTNYIQSKGYCIPNKITSENWSFQNFQFEPSRQFTTVPSNSNTGMTKSTDNTDIASSQALYKIVPASYTGLTQTPKGTVNGNNLNILPVQNMPDSKPIQPVVPASSGLIKKTSDLTVRPIPASNSPDSAIKPPEPTSQIKKNDNGNPVTYGTNLAPVIKPSYTPELYQQSYEAKIPQTQPSTPINYEVLPQRQSATTGVNSGNSVMKIKDCSMLPNSYWTGYKCSCKVGYTTVGGICAQTPKNMSQSPIRPAQFVHKISALDGRKKDCRDENERWDGIECVCTEGCFRGPAGKCIRPSSKPQAQDKDEDYYIDDKSQQNTIGCPANSRKAGAQCVCLGGFTKVKNQCRPTRKECPPNSNLSEEGLCICKNGYAKVDNECVFRSMCGPNSSPDRYGQCQCDKGYSMYDGQCQQCPANQIIISGQCSITCGVNQAINRVTNKCECLEGYALMNKICRECPAQYFPHHGYCVDCPIRKVFSRQLGQCVCQEIYQNLNGQCLDRCPQNQIYSPQAKSCVCRQGLIRINGKCKMCPGGYNAISEQCQVGSQCKINQVRSGSTCICKPGFGYSLNQICIKCDNLPSSILVDGFCVLCPLNTQNVDGKCLCGKGRKLVEGNCVDTCKPNQIMDANGNCYYCLINEQAVNGVCLCQRGFEKVNGYCRAKCPANTNQINGMCASCALGTEYDRARRICRCPQGSYTNSNGLCQVSVRSCGQSFFYSKTTQRCEPCPYGCKSCSSATICSQCSLQGLYLSSAACKPICGDGILAGNEACDDGNNLSKDGCSSNCEIEAGSTCVGSKPTRCTIPQPVCGDGVVSGNQQCDDRNYVRGDGCYNCLVQTGWKCLMNQCTKIVQPMPEPTQPVMASTCSGGVNLKLMGQPIINQNNVFASVQTPSAFKFSSSSEMREFMKYEFTMAGTEPSSAYCIQRPSNPRIYECLIIYASGVPNRVFNINFGYSYGGESGRLCVTINPSSSFIKTRSLK